MKVKDRIIRSIANRKGMVVIRSDLRNLGSDAQVSRVLKELIAEGRLVRVSLGAFAKTRINLFTGKPTPAGTLESIALELFKKLKIEVQPSRLTQEYNNGKSTQVPMKVVINTGCRKISRQVKVGDRMLAYENNSTKDPSLSTKVLLGE